VSFSEGAGSHRAADLVLEGVPPDSGRPSWLVLAVGVVAALLIGLGVGYGVGITPTVTPEPTLAVASTQPSPSPITTPLGHPFIADPCRLVPNPILAGGDYIARYDPSALAGMVDCTYLVPGLGPGGRVLAAVSLRQAPTTAEELAVTVDEVFQGEGVNEASIEGQHAYFVPCAHAWTPCRPALAVVHEPYFLVISLGPDEGGLEVVSALAAGILRSLPN
jgi:hypothetical protein